jgi:hypothetical protein
MANVWPKAGVGYDELANDAVLVYRISGSFIPRISLATYRIHWLNHAQDMPTNQVDDTEIKGVMHYLPELFDYSKILFIK